MCLLKFCYWNWSRSFSCDDEIFMFGCINYSLKKEIQWPDANVQRHLGNMNIDFLGCIKNKRQYFGGDFKTLEEQYAHQMIQ